MKKSILLMTAAAMMAMGCKSDKQPAQGSYVGPSEITISDGHFTPEALLSLGRLSDPQLSPDGTKILYGVSYTSLEDNRSVRNLYICNVDGSGKVQLTSEGKSISNARWSRDGKHIFYLKGGQLYKAPFKDGTLGRSRCLSNVKEGIGEFSLSPDESRVMWSGTVPNPKLTGPADTDPALDKAKAYVTEDLMYRHWDHWVETIPQTYVAELGQTAFTQEGSVNILGEDAGKYELPIEPFSGLEQCSWSPDGRFIAYSCKKLAGKEYAFSTNTDIYIWDTQSGKTTCIPVGGGYDTEPLWSPDGTRLAWIRMERDGYEADKTRLMVAKVLPLSDGSVSFEEVMDLTANFKYNAAGPVWSADSKSIYFNSSAEGIQGIFLARGFKGDIVRLTDENLWYNFNSPFAVLEDGTLLTSYCSLEFPNELVAVKCGTGEASMTAHTDGLFLDPVNGEEIVKDKYLYAECPVISGATLTRITHENDHILDQLDPVAMEARWTKTVDGERMLTWILYPPKFDPSKIYPAIEILLGGPQGALDQGWSYRWNYRLMASQGYIVTMPNRRGTTSFGQPWCEEISGDYPGLNMQDYLTAGRNIKAEPYVGKLAACGASYGGYSVYYLAGIHGDLYDCFIAHAGIFDEKYMWSETEEMWFPNWDNGGLTEYAYEPGKTGPEGDGVTFGGLQQAGAPWSTAAKAVRHYSNSPMDRITSWHTPILCIHGMMDFRIPYDQGMAAFNSAQMMGVPSKLIVFPEECHWILQPQNALFWHREYFDWLQRWCKD